MSSHHIYMLIFIHFKKIYDRVLLLYKKKNIILYNNKYYVMYSKNISKSCLLNPNSITLNEPHNTHLHKNILLCHFFYRRSSCLVIFLYLHILLLYTLFTYLLKMSHMVYQLSVRGRKKESCFVL